MAATNGNYFFFITLMNDVAIHHRQIIVVRSWVLDTKPLSSLGNVT